MISQFKNKIPAPNNIFNQIETDLQMIKGECLKSAQFQSTNHEKEMQNEVIQHLNLMIKINTQQHIKFKSNFLSIDDYNQGLIKQNHTSQKNNIKYNVVINIQNELIIEEFEQPQSFRDFFLFLLQKFPQKLKSFFVILDENNQICNIHWDDVIIYGTNNQEFYFTIQQLDNYLNNLQQQIQALKDEIKYLLIKQNELQDQLQQKEQLEFKYKRSQIQFKKDFQLKVEQNQINEYQQIEKSDTMKQQQQMNNEQQFVNQQQINQQQLINKLQESNKQHFLKQTEQINPIQQDPINRNQKQIFNSYNPQFSAHSSNLKFYSIISGKDSLQRNKESQMEIIFYTCQYCQKKFENQQIILKCLHIYHEDCLKEILKNQIQLKKPILNCLCNNKITNLSRFSFLEVELLQQFYINQLNAILMKNEKQFRKCNKCQFIHIEQRENQKQQEICYQCGVKNIF